MTLYQQLPTVYPPTRLQKTPWRHRSLATHACILLVYVGVSYYLYLTIRRPSGTIALSVKVEKAVLYRDAQPLRTIERYHRQAEEEIRARQLDTCNGKLGAALLDAYTRTRIDYTTGGTAIECVSVQADADSAWWPVPEAPCLAEGLRGDGRAYGHVNSNITSAGLDLQKSLGHERFLGSKLEAVDACGIRGDGRTLLIIPRQDQFNPFHVGEDMVRLYTMCRSDSTPSSVIPLTLPPVPSSFPPPPPIQSSLETIRSTSHPQVTTVLTTLVAVRLKPDWIDDRVQVVFDDDFGVEGNHFVPMWDRIGAWAPRRLGLDPWKNECLSRSIHSVGAGVSLLSAGGVANRMPCASSITWAASLYYRRLFALEPVKAINVLWLSRAKFDEWQMSHNEWSRYRAIRHIYNEDELVGRIRRGLQALDGFQEVDDLGWAASGGIRFATIDPSVHSLETQVRYLGHATIVVGSHGGAMGLTLFMPPGAGTVVELAVPEVAVNRHFDIIASHLGLQYEQVRIEQTVDVEAVWEVVRKHVWAAQRS